MYRNLEFPARKAQACYFS